MRELSWSGVDVNGVHIALWWGCMERGDEGYREYAFKVENVKNVSAYS